MRPDDADGAPHAERRAVRGSPALKKDSANHALSVGEANSNGSAAGPHDVSAGGHQFWAPNLVFQELCQCTYIADAIDIDIVAGEGRESHYE